MEREAVIVEAVRSAAGKNRGKLKDWRPDDLAGKIIRELVNRTGIDERIIDDVILGCVTQTGEQGLCIARLAVLTAGLPVTVPGVTVQRHCSSGQQAVYFAAQGIMTGTNDVVIAGGVESMTRVPMMDGKFKEEIVPVPVNGGEMFSVDEGIRFDPVSGILTTSLEKLAKLKPAFKKNGLITAGNSSQISDGAAALLLCSREKADQLDLQPKAVVRQMVQVGVDPTIMLTGPIPATEKALAKSGLTIDDIDLFEVNEAFAPVPLAWLKETGADPGKVNVNGGAVALGHPLGCTGAKLTTTIVHEMGRRKAFRGLVSLCQGFGMGSAMILERCE
ncbi:MAG: thiolase family protein [Candidatus Hodarchaeales archaeon]